ncbi:DNA-binding transcriptional MerR regulator [Robbsia andropogonis]
MDKAATAALPLPPIPAKRYFTIGEVSELCGVKPHVLRYWEQEFTQLKPVKRRGNRRYYQHHEVLLIRRIRDLLYEQGFTINGARNKLSGGAHAHDEEEDLHVAGGVLAEGEANGPDGSDVLSIGERQANPFDNAAVDLSRLRDDLVEVRDALRAAVSQATAKGTSLVARPSAEARLQGRGSTGSASAAISAAERAQEQALEFDFGDEANPEHSPEQES